MKLVEFVEDAVPKKQALWPEELPAKKKSLTTEEEEELVKTFHGRRYASFCKTKMPQTDLQHWKPGFRSKTFFYAI